MLDQQRDVFGALSKSRQMDGDDAQPVIQILPDRSGFQRFLDRLIGGGDDPHIDRILSRVSEMANPALLQHPHQFHLKLG